MSEFIKDKEPFKLGLLDKVPSPEEGECFLLYQEGAGSANSVLINYGVRYSSTEIRHGRYNQKAIFSLEEKAFNQNYRIMMEDNNFYYDVTIKMSYILQDVKVYFFQGILEEGDIQQAIRSIIRRQDGKWDILGEAKLQSELETEIEKKLKQYEGIRFKQLEVVVRPEADAEKLRESNKSKTVGIHVAKNETDEKIARNEQNERIIESERKLKSKQIEDMALMWKNFGDMGAIVNEYFKGKIDGKELYNYILRARSEKMGMLQTVASNDMMTGNEILNELNKVLSNNEFLQIAESQQLSGEEAGKSEKKEAEDKDTEVPDREEEETNDEDTFSDGDYI